MTPNVNPSCHLDHRSDGLSASRPRHPAALVARGYAARRLLSVAVPGLLALAACAPMQGAGHDVAQAGTLSALTAEGQLVRFTADQPGSLLDTRSIHGFADDVVGAARDGQGWLLIRRDGHLQRVAADGREAAKAAPWPFPAAVPGAGEPARCPPDLARHPVHPHWRVLARGLHARLQTADLRLVDGDAGWPGVQADATLRYAPGDVNYGRVPQLAAVAHAAPRAIGSDPAGAREVTTYAIDATTASLVSLGSVAGTLPREAPQIGRLHTIGALGAGAWHCARLTIATDAEGASVGYAALTGERTDLYRIDLAKGAAQWIGTLPAQGPVLGLWAAPPEGR